MIDFEMKDLFFKSSVEKQWIIEAVDTGARITNEELEQQSIELTESLCSEERLRFGSCEASALKFKVHNVVFPLKNQKIKVTIQLNKNQSIPFLLGEYRVYSDKPTADKRYREIVAYDSMYDILGVDVAEWYNGLTFPKTLKDFRDSFLGYLGIEQEKTELPNDKMIVTKTIEPSELSGKTVITSVCEINGCFGHIGRDGKFRYVFLGELIEGVYPSTELFPSNDLFPSEPQNSIKIPKQYYQNATYEDFKTEKINKLQINTEENDIGYIHGDGDNCYIVQDNLLCYGMKKNDLEKVAKNMYEVIKKVSYRPSKIETIGNPCLEVGDGIRLQTKYKIIYTYILQRTIKGIQTLKDAYEANGEERQNANVNSVRDSIIQLKGRSNRLTRSLEETRLEISDMEKGLESKITQNAESITLKVSKDSIISEINQTAEKITIKAEKIDLDGLVNAKQLTAKFATITSLNATNAAIENIKANYVTAETLNANMINVAGAITAVDAKFGALNADNITSGTIGADRISVDTITGKLNGQYVGCATLACGSFVYQSYSVSWRSLTLEDGTTIRYLG